MEEGGPCDKLESYQGKSSDTFMQFHKTVATRALYHRCDSRGTVV